MNEFFISVIALFGFAFGAVFVATVYHANLLMLQRERKDLERREGLIREKAAELKNFNSQRAAEFAQKRSAMQSTIRNILALLAGQVSDPDARRQLETMVDQLSKEEMV